ncbi:MAG TPA: hypothetical protein VMN36_15010 [Verrucomicrobiales bacterium]|nr:hypothetical protein [Verrucomicrobiales bacterium]
MPDETTPHEKQLKLYGKLVDQRQNYTTILWQFPTALLAANAFAIDKFHSQPLILLALGVVDGILAYSFRRLVIQQRSIITATRAAEGILRKTEFSAFIPNFSSARGSVSCILNHHDL